MTIPMKLIVAAFAMAVLVSSNAAIAGEGWTLVRTIVNGHVEIVVIDKDRMMDTSIYRMAIAKSRACKDVLQGRRGLCQVKFWIDSTMTPTRFPMTDAQSNAMVATWTYNRHTGYRQLLWSCRIVSDPSQCFS